MNVADFRVTVHYGPCLLGPLEFQLPAPYRLLVIGSSGAGKSTLLTALAGLSPHGVQGRVCLTPHTGEGPGEHGEGRGRVLLGVQEASEAFTPYRRVGAQLADSMGAPSPSRFRQKNAEFLAELGLDDSALALFPHQISGGMLKRLLLAGLCAAEPDLLLLDEPTAGIDPSRRRGVWSMLQRVESPVIVATHDWDALQRFEQAYVLHLQKGQAVAFCPAATYSPQGSNEVRS